MKKTRKPDRTRTARAQAETLARKQQRQAKLFMLATALPAPAFAT